MKNLIIAICLTLAGCASAQPYRYNQGGATTKNYFAELKYEDVNGKFFVTVEVGGKPRRFLFDTGAVTMVSDSLASELKLAQLYEDDVKDVNGAHFKSVVVTVDVKYGNTTFSHIPALKGLKSALFNCWKIDGILGSNLLRSSIVCFNTGKKTITVTDQKDKLKFNKANSGVMKTNIDIQSTPLIVMPFSKKFNVMIEFDSGDNQFLRLTEKLAKQFPNNLYHPVDTGYGASGIGVMGLQKAARKQRIIIPKFTVGGQEFNNAVTEISAQGIPGVGTKLLKYGTLTLDYIHQKYYFDPFEAIVNANTSEWPLHPTVVNSQLVVGVVWSGLDGRIKPGDQITTIDGIDYTTVDLCTIINNKPILEGKESATFTIRSAGGSTQQITLKRRDYSANTSASH